MTMKSCTQRRLVTAPRVVTDLWFHRRGGTDNDLARDLHVLVAVAAHAQRESRRRALRNVSRKTVATAQMPVNAI